MLQAAGSPRAITARPQEQGAELEDEMDTIDTMDRTDKADLGYRVHGTLVDRDTGAPVAGLRVRAYDKDFFREQRLGESETDANGRYAIGFGRDDFSGPLIRLERRPDIFLEVFDAEGRLIYSTERSVVVDAGRDTAIDLRVPGGQRGDQGEAVTSLFGVAVNVQEAARLTAAEIVDAYRLMRGHAGIRQADRLRRVFPGIFARDQGSPECGNGIYEVFRYLLLERNAGELLADVEADPFSGATIHQFFTANIVVKYSTDATLPDGSPNPNALPAPSAVMPAADSAYAMPNGTAIGTVRLALADLDGANSEVAPIYIQKVGLLAEYALSRYINAPFSYLDPRGTLARLEFLILGLPAGVAGYAVPSDFHMELSAANSDGQNLGTVPHELFHLVQFRYNATGNVAGGVRQVMLEGGARLLEESINETPNRYVESAAEGAVAGSVPRKGIFQFPGETLIDVGGADSPLRYAAGLLWKYIAEQHSIHTSAADEPAIGVDSYRTIIERMTPAADGFTVAAIRNGRAQLPWYGTFDQFGYYDAAATELGSHETTWGNFLIANYYHRLWVAGAAGHDRRFDYLEDDDPAGNVSQLRTYGPAVAAGDQIGVAQGAAVTRNVVGHKPFAAVYYELNPGTPAPRMLRINVTTAAGMSDPVIQILRIGAANALLDVHRSDRTAWSKTIDMAGLSRVVVIVASREHGGDFTVHFDEVAAASDVMVTRWNSAVGTEYEVDPAGWSWAWISPDIMVDTDNDGNDDGNVFFGQNNKLKVRLRNRGNAAAADIRLDFWYQKATPYLTTAGWIPVQSQALVTQVLTGLSLAPGAENWFEVDWAPVDDGSGQHHYCVKVLATVAGDPNADNKMAFRNFNNVEVHPDTGFDALIRFADWRRGDLLQVIPRGRAGSLRIENVERFTTVVEQGCNPRAAERRLIHGAPLDMVFARVRLAGAELRQWDGRSTLPPEESGAFYPVDERTLPPGIKGSDIVTIAHVRDGHPFGGVSYRLVRK
jgi:hypothetical protein